VLEALTADDFRPHVGSTFRATNVEPESVDLTLSEVTVYPGQPDAPRADPFSLMFTGPAGVALPQHIYDLAHEAMGTLQIFLVPTAPGEYEAVFN
jgi:hypothetical protein